MPSLMGFTGVIGAGFVPSGSPVGWWKADKGVLDSEGSPCGDGDKVATWEDQSGNGNDLVQSVDAKRPLLRTGIQNGQSVVRFDGTDDFLGVALGELTQPNTIFVAGGWVSNTVGRRFFSGQAFSSNRHLCWDNSGQWAMYAGTIDSIVAVSTGFKIISTLWSGANSWFRLNTSETAANVGTNTLKGFSVASSYSGGDCGNIDVAEIVIYDGSESPTGNETGLNAKYAVY